MDEVQVLVNGELTPAPEVLKRVTGFFNAKRGSGRVLEDQRWDKVGLAKDTNCPGAGGNWDSDRRQSENANRH